MTHTPSAPLPFDPARKARRGKPPAPARYVEFATASNFSFLRGASHPEELMAQARNFGLSGLGLCDRNSVAGVVRPHVVKREHEMPLAYHPGARLVFADGTPDILAYPRGRAGWGHLCRLLTIGNLRAKKGDCLLYVEDLLAHCGDVLGKTGNESLELIVMERCTAAHADAGMASRHNASPHPEHKTKIDWMPLLETLCEAAPGRVRLAATMLYGGQDRVRLTRLRKRARKAGVPAIAVNDVHFHHPDRREMADVLTCIRAHVSIDKAGRQLAANAERFLKPPAEMARLFRDAPEMIDETLALSERLTFNLDELGYDYPDDNIVPGFSSPQEALTYLAHEGARRRYPQGVPDTVTKAIAHELALIARVKYAPYFLTVYDIVRYAREQNILCQGRGSAANSAVCYCLGITEVDPGIVDLLFERFISEDRGEPPDIDVDFEHERREEVIQYIYRRYGRDRAGIAGTVISYRGRSAIREVGKVFGFSEDMIGALASSIWGMGGGSVSQQDIARAGLDTQSARVQMVVERVEEILSFPRHLSQHVGGFVITRGRLDDTVPILNGAMEDRTFIEWNKDDLDDLNILKIDVLALGMLTCLRKGLDLVDRHYPDAFEDRQARAFLLPLPDPDPTRRQSVTASAVPSLPARVDLSAIKKEEKAIYDMLSRADSLGVFQVESRAQMSMLPRLRPEKFYDLVIEVAIVRPGPIQGDMVHPYLRRRQGIEPVNYPSKELEAVLWRTLGVPLFQEQAMRIAIVAGGFTPTEADKLRRAMATFKRVGTIGTFKKKMIDGMENNGYERDFAERCFQQIEGFGEYGFPESHAASFALLVYDSAWLKCRYPDAFAAALLNAQPMGFYAPAQIVRDAREHGVEVRPVDVNLSAYDCTLEPGPAGYRAGDHVHHLHEGMRADIRTTHALRLGLREVKGLKEDDADLIAAKRHTPFVSVRDLWLRTGLPARVIERLADADAFGSLGLTRREALWQAKALGRAGDKDDLPLFRDVTLPAATVFENVSDAHREPVVMLPRMTLGEEVVNDYRFLKMSLKAHPASFLRDELDGRRIMRNDALRTTPSGQRVTLAGLVTCRQRPGSAQGVVFMTIEDETAFANIIIWPKIFLRFRPVVLGARFVAVRGRMQQQDGVIHVVAEAIEDLTPLLSRLADGEPIASHARCDDVKRPEPGSRGGGRSGHPPFPMQDERPAPMGHAEAERRIDLASDFEVSAPGSAHAPARKAGGVHTAAHTAARGIR